MAFRVFQLAKELGVKSKAIVEKCQAEGLDSVTNHMSVLSAGLSETIREWFSEEGGAATAVETSAPVDLKKAKTTRKRKTKAAEEKGSADQSTDQGATAVAVVEQSADVAGKSETDAGTAVVEPPSGRPKRLSPTEVAALDGQQSEPGEEDTQQPPATPSEAPPAQAPAAAQIEQEPQSAEPAAASDEPPAKEKSPVKPPEPFVPKPAQLQGPKVIRVERAEQISAPPSRPSNRRTPLSASDLNIGANGGSGTGDKKPVRGRSMAPAEEDKGKGGKGAKRNRSSRHRERQELDEAVKRGGWGDRDWQERQERLASASGAKLHRRERQMAHSERGGTTGTFGSPAKIDKATVKEPITVKDLSAALGIRAGDIIGKLMTNGVMATINQVIDKEAAATIAMEYDVELTIEEKVLLLDKFREEFDAEVPDEELTPRPPIVAFLGHVDHGKTSLLDRIRKAQVVSSEAGGITQHIGSYLYDDGERRVAFLDTPGHKAFTAMRARGANMTDIVVLVVAADDGMMPQTEEAINHAKAAGVSIVVAMNKIDLPNADENKILGQLAEKELVPTAWGGDVEVVKTSATTGEGIDDLVEYLDYVAELKQLKAKAVGPATGWVVEAQMTQGQGSVTRLLVKQGSLKPGDSVVTGSCYGRVRTITDATGSPLDEAGPGTPIVVTGLDGVPTAGDRFYVVESIAVAKEAAEEQQAQDREVQLAQRRHVTLENLFSEIKAGDLKELNVIIKADVQGSVDVLVKSIQELNTSEVAVRVLHAAVGGITESDVLLAEASDAIIIGFQVVADEHSKGLAEREGVEIRLYRVIYQITDDIQKALEGMLAPTIEEKTLGRAVVRQVFKVSRLGNIAGCAVSDGVIQKKAKIRLIREGIVVTDGIDIDSLKRVKDDVNEVRKGLECGIKLAGYDDLKEEDTLEAYEHVEVSRTLDSVK